MSDSILDVLTNPAISSLLGMTAGFGQAAMPTRVPTSFGAVLGQGAGGLLQGIRSGEQNQLSAQQIQAAKINNARANMWLDYYKQSQQPGGSVGGASAMPMVGGAGGSSAPAQGSPMSASINAASPASPAGPLSMSGASGVAPATPVMPSMPNAPAASGQSTGGAPPYMVSPQAMINLGQLMLGTGETAAGERMIELGTNMAKGGYGTDANGRGFVVPGGSADPVNTYNSELAKASAGVGPAIATAVGTEAARAPYAKPIEVQQPVFGSNGQQIGTKTVQIPVNQWAAQNNGTAPAATGATAGADPFPGWAKQIVGGEQGATPDAKNPNSTAQGNGQFLDSTWPSVIRATRPDLTAGKSDAQLMDLRNDPALALQATEAYARQNAGYLAQRGLPVTGATVGMAHFLGPAGAATVLGATPNAPLEMLPGMAAPIAANPSLKGQTAGSLTQNYVQRFGAAAPGGSGAPIYGGALKLDQTPENAYNEEYAKSSARVGPGVRQAVETASGTKAAEAPYAKPIEVQQPVFGPNGQQIGVRNLQIPVTQYAAQNGGGAPAATGVTAIPGQNPGQNAIYGGEVKLNENMKPFDVRQGGMYVDPSTGTEIKNPELVKSQDAQGNTVYGHVNPPSPYAPPGTPGTFVPVVGPNGKQAVEALPAQVTKSREEMMDDLVHKDADSYVAAQNTQGWLQQIQHAAGVMNQGGPLYMTGPNAGARYDAMSNINDYARTLGIPVPFNQNAVASWEEMKKATTTAGFELSSHYEGHARQAAATIQNATSAVPAAANSPEGLQLVTNGIREGAQSAIDLHEYKLGVADKTQGAGLLTADADFYKNNTPTMYANRAISTVKPFSVSTDADLTKYLPGTFVTYKGNRVQVPARDGAPGIPNYLQPGAPQ